MTPAKSFTKSFRKLFTLQASSVPVNINSIGSKISCCQIVFCKLAVSLSLIVLNGCFGTNYDFKYGIQSPSASYASASIAVLECNFWPSTAAVKEVGEINTGPTIRAQICDTFNKELLKSFRGQPYVKGRSPRSIEKILRERNRLELLTGIFDEWQTPADCEYCEDPVQYYKYHLENNPNWIKYTNELSRATDFSDAALLPIVTHAKESHINERGLIRAKREAKVVVFLFDLESGALLWAGNRNASASNSSFNNDIGDNKLLFPDWDIVYQRLFANSLWADFPGRQEK